MDLLDNALHGARRRKESLTSAPPRGTLPVILEAMLLKKGVAMTQWKQRWCSLEGNRTSGGAVWLYYSESRTSLAKGAFSLKGSVASKTHSKAHLHVLELTWPRAQGPDRGPRRFACSSAEELERWYEHVVELNGQDALRSPRSDPARKEQLAQQEARRLEVRLHLAAFKSVWIPAPIEGRVHNELGEWTLLPVGTFECTAGPWQGVSGSWRDSDDEIAIVVALNEGFPPIRATFSPMGMCFTFLDASWTAEFSSDTHEPINVEGFDVQSTVAHGAVPPWLTLYVAGLANWRRLSQPMLEDLFEQLRASSWRQAQFDRVRPQWERECTSCHGFKWLVCMQCLVAWCSNANTPRCFAGAAPHECPRCHNYSGRPPPKSAGEWAQPTDEQLRHLPYPSIPWTKYMLD